MTGSKTGKAEIFYDKNYMFSFVIWMVLCVASLCVMLRTASQKSIMLADESNEKISISAQQDALPRTVSIQKLNFEGGASPRGSISVPFEKGISAGDVRIENRYMDRQLRIYIRGASLSFYKNNVITGDISAISGGECLEQNGNLVLVIHLNEIYEFQTTMNSDTMDISRKKLKDSYQMVVVLDAEQDENEIASKIAALVPEKLNRQEIKVFVLDLDDEHFTDEEELQFINEADSAIFIRVGLDSAEDSSDYGITGIYNDEFYIPDFGNVEFADIVIKAVTISASNRANGLVAAKDEGILKNLKIPAVKLLAGNLSNEKERELLSNEEYQNMLADGIANAIIETYGVLYETDAPRPGNASTDEGRKKTTVFDSGQAF